MCITEQDWNQSSLSEIIVGTGLGKAFCAGGDVSSKHIVNHAFLRGLTRIAVVQNLNDQNTVPQALDFFKQE